MLFPLAEAFSGPLYQSVFLIANNINELWFTEVEEEFTGMITESRRMDKKPQESGLGNRQELREAKQPGTQRSLPQKQPD